MYQAPIDDIAFGLKHLVGLDSIAKLPDMEMVSDDLVTAVLDEAMLQNWSTPVPMCWWLAPRYSRPRIPKLKSLCSRKLVPPSVSKCG